MFSRWTSLQLEASVISVNTCSELTAGVLLDVMLPDQYYLTIKNDSSAILSSGRGGLDSGKNLVTHTYTRDSNPSPKAGTRVRLSYALPRQRATYCEGRSQGLNGDSTWPGVYESARPPIAASPHLAQARSRRFISSFAAKNAAA
jgi:hypothetical protein